MSTVRAEVSKKSQHWIEKHRYYELKHFCLQYPIWKRAYLEIDGYNARPTDFGVCHKTFTHSDPTFKAVETREFYKDRIEMIERAAIDADPGLASYILRAVTEGMSYTCLKFRLDMPCGREKYYNCYRKFFWLLSQARQ